MTIFQWHSRQHVGAIFLAPNSGHQKSYFLILFALNPPFAEPQEASESGEAVFQTPTPPTKGSEKWPLGPEILFFFQEEDVLSGGKLVLQIVISALETLRRYSYSTVLSNIKINSMILLSNSTNMILIAKELHTYYWYWYHASDLEIVRFCHWHHSIIFMLLVV